MNNKRPNLRKQIFGELSVAGFVVYLSFLLIAAAFFAFNVVLALIITVLILAIATEVLTNAISDNVRKWLTNKEQGELRSIDLNLMANEHNLEFSVDDRPLSRKIMSSLELLRYPQFELVNLMHELKETGRILIFDHLSEQFHTQPQPRENSNEQRLTGVGVLFEYQTVPQFLLIHQSIWSKVSINGSLIGFTYSKLEAENYPAWLSASDYFCFYQGTPNRVINFLMLNRSLSVITEESSIRLMSFQDDMVVAFFEQELIADGSNLDQFKQFGQRMLELQGDETEPREKRPGSI